VIDARTTEQRNNDAALFAAELSQNIDTLDLHSQDRADALQQTGAFLDRAFMEGVKTVRIVHGKGSGILRDAVRRFVQNHPHVAAWRPAPGSHALAALHVVLHAKE
jgi:DNA mismatch repair protein MutS2